MNFSIIQFYLFTWNILISSTLVVFSNNSVYSILFLIMVFCNISGLLFYIGAEFLSLLILIVYVGAIAVLFLFVIMMLNIKITRLRFNIKDYIFFFTNLNIVFLFYFQILLYVSEINGYNLILEEFYKNLDFYSNYWHTNIIGNIYVIGNLLYTNYTIIFLLCSIILLIAIIGVILLTLHQRTHVRRQNTSIQLRRGFNLSVKFKSISLIS